MPTDHPATAPQVAVRASDTTLFASLELSKARWLVTVSAPGGEKLSRYTVAGGAGGALLDLLARLRTTVERRAGLPVRVVVIQEAGLDRGRPAAPPGQDRRDRRREARAHAR
jgi:transposase